MMSGDSEKSSNRGCAIGCGALAALVILSSFISWAWDEISNRSIEKIPYSITIDVNSGITEKWVVGGGSGCNHPNYEVTISNSNRVGSGIVARHKLARGVMVDNVFCRYTITGQIPRHSKYWVKVETFIGDPTILAKTIDLPASSPKLLGELRWYHYRDNN